MNFIENLNQNPFRYIEKSQILVVVPNNKYFVLFREIQACDTPLGTAATSPHSFDLENLIHVSLYILKIHVPQTTTDCDALLARGYALNVTDLTDFFVVKNIIYLRWVAKLH
jgi:hypothetical protein